MPGSEQNTGSKKHLFTNAVNGPERALEIWQLFAAGKSVNELAELYNVRPRRMLKFLLTNKKKYYTLSKANRPDEWVIMRASQLSENKENSNDATAGTLPEIKIRAPKVKAPPKPKPRIKKAKDPEVAEAMLVYLKEFADLLGRTPVKKDFNVRSRYRYSEYIYYFTRITKARELAGVAPPVFQKLKPISSESCINDLQNIELQLGQIPTWHEVMKYGRYSLVTYRKRLGKEITKYIQSKKNASLKYLLHEKTKMLAYLQTTAARNDDTSLYYQLIADEKFDMRLCKKYFGSFRKAQILAGLTPTMYIGRKPQTLDLKEIESIKERLLEKLKRIAAEKGQSPKAREMDIAQPGSYYKYQKYFGSFRKAQILAGLTPLRYSGRESQTLDLKEIESIKERLLEKLKRIAAEKGRCPYGREISRRPPDSYYDYKKYFGNWNNALKQAGLTFAPTPGRKITAPEDIEQIRQLLLADLAFAANQLGAPPTQKILLEKLKHSNSSYRKYFGSLSAAALQSGIALKGNAEHAKYNLKGHESEKKNILISYLKEFAENLGHTPSASTMDKKGKYSYGSYKKYFGSWKNAQTLAGLNHNGGGLKRIAPAEDKNAIKAILTEALKTYALSTGKTPTVTEFTAHGKYDSATCRKYFGSWYNALIAAGITPLRKPQVIFKGPVEDIKAVLLTDLKALAAKLRRTPSREDIVAYSKYSNESYIKYFGTLSQAKKQAGLPYFPRPQK